jgi:uncharacterized BrkB/YihY/UPF0761 family membrane protein
MTLSIFPLLFLAISVRNFFFNKQKELYLKLIQEVVDCWTQIQERKKRKVKKK